MEFVKSLFDAAPILPLFICVALGYAIGRVRIGQFQLGGIPGTLFAGILVGQIGVEVDDNIKTIAFALFIYSLGYVSGPQFFSSLGRSTLSQVHLAVFSAIVVFLTIWGLAYALDLDKGTAAGLLAGATTESASIGTTSEALRHLGLDAAEAARLEANIGVSYAVTYLFGFTLVVFFASTVAPKMMGVDLKTSAKELESDLGSPEEELGPGQREALGQISARVHQVTEEGAVGVTRAEFEARYNGDIRIRQVARRGRARDVTPDFELALGDRVLIAGRRENVAEAGATLGEETANIRGLGYVSETRDVILTNRDFVGGTLQKAAAQVNPELARGVDVIKLTRSGRPIVPRPRTRLEAGDILTLVGPAEMMDEATQTLGYMPDKGDAVDYVYLGLGIIVGILLGMVSVTIAGSPVALHTGGGCLIAGLVFGWLRSMRPTFGSLPQATALHLRDFGLSIFVASVGLATGPQALTQLAEQGLLLPALAIVVVLVTLIASMSYARYVLKMHPAVVCGALAGVLTCTAGLNAAVQQAESETPVLGYTVPYALANVFLTLLGPVIVLTV